MTDDDYIARNRRLARQWIGRQLDSVVRLLNVEPEPGEPIAEAWGAVLAATRDGQHYLIDCEESRSNIILFELPEPRSGPLWESIARYPIRPAIAKAGDPLHVIVEQPIVAIEEMSRRDPQGWFEMCGLRLTCSGGARVCVGTHLTEARIPATAFLTTDQVDPRVEYSALGDRPP